MGNTLGKIFRSLSSTDDAEKSAKPSSPARTTTSNISPPPISQPIPSPPVVTDIPPGHLSTVGGPIRNLTGSTPVGPSPQQPPPSATSATNRSHAPQLSIPTNTLTSQGKRPEKDASTVDSDPDDLDMIFEEAWKPGNGLKLADGSELPWAKGTSSPSAAAKYLDDIEV